MTTPKLTAATLFKGTGSLLMKYEFDGPVPLSDTFLVGTFGRSADGNTIRQYGIKFLDGAEIAYFVFDHNAAKQTNLQDITPTIEDNLILAPYSDDHFKELGEGATFDAYVNARGHDTQTEFPVTVVS